MEQHSPWCPERQGIPEDAANPKPRADSLHKSVRGVDTASNRAGPTATKVFSIPGKDVLGFVMSPNPRHTKHYFAALSAIQARIQAAVAAVTSDGQMSLDGLSFQPMMVGKNESDARLHMAVLCEPSLAPIIEDAFTHGPIQSELGIPNSVESLGYIVIPEPYEEVNAQLAVELFSQTRYDAKHGTYCGAPLIVRHKNAVRQATFGGVIKVSYANGDCGFYGMTAGHVTRASQQHRHQLSKASIADSESTHDPFGVSNWLSSESLLGKPLDPDQLPGVKAQRTKPSHDWCIFETRAPRTNRALQVRRGQSLTEVGANTEDSGHPILIAQSPAFNDDMSDPVLVLGAAAGTRRGALSNLPASLWMASCQSFVSVYVLQMSGDQKVVKGDSGAWVVHAAGPALYGHVVATNTFGEAYVIPANDAFENIKDCLGATSVTLPTGADLTCDPFIESSPHSKQMPALEAEHSCCRQPHRSQMNHALYGPKVWDPKMFEHRLTIDRPFLDTLGLQDHHTELDILKGFLAPIGTLDPSWAITDAHNNTKCRDQQLTTTHRHVYLDDRFRDSFDYQAKWIRADELCSHLLISEGEKGDFSRGCHRRLIYVPQLDSDALVALVKHASWYQAQALRCAVRAHVASASCLRINTSKRGPSQYQLEFNLPYFTIYQPASFDAKKSRHIESGTQDLRKHYNLIDLNISVYQSFTTVVISGQSNSSWFGYAFGSLDNSEESEEEICDIDEDEDEDDGYWRDALCQVTDLFATAGCELSSYDLLAPGSVWNPRIYFLRVLHLRLQSIIQSHEYLVRKLGESLDAWMTDIPHKKSPWQNLETLRTTEKLLRHIRTQFRNATQTWDRFNAANGDVSFLEDLSSADARLLFHNIEEAFESWKDLSHVLDDMILESETSIHTLQLRMTLESNKLARHMLDVHLEVSKSSETTADLARIAQAVTEDKSREGRVNVQLAMVTGILLIVMQYFTSERSIFAFERTQRTFFITIAILMPSLFILSFLLRAIDGLRDAVRSRLLGKLQEPSDWRHSKRVPCADPVLKKENILV